jgi:hypothetical protein
MRVILAAVMAVVAAVLFAVAAAAQNGAVATVVGNELGTGTDGPTCAISASAVVGRRELYALARSRVWLAGVSLNAVASVVHAGALILAPVAIVQPISNDYGTGLAS